MKLLLLNFTCYNKFIWFLAENLDMKMGALRVRLNVVAIQVLAAELQPVEMAAVHLMALGKEMPESVSKLDLTRIIFCLCKKLNWIERDNAGLATNSIFFCFLFVKTH